MQFVNNDPDQIEIRKSQNTLIVVGTGTILFGAWTLIKALGMLFVLREETVAAMKANFANLADIPDGMIFWVIVVMAFIFLTISLAVRAYVGMAAISEGRGQRRSILYLLLAVIMITVSAFSFCTGFFTVEAPEEMGALTRNQSISALIIEATSMIMMIQMVVSALKIRKLTGTARHAED